MSGEIIGIIGTIIGCFIGLAGWLSGRDKKISNDAEWRGMVNTKLDSILGLRTDVEHLEKEVKQHGERITAVESSVKSAHHRIDKIEVKGA